MFINDIPFLYDDKEKCLLIDFCLIHKIQIPRFCYHEKLSVAGNCRMCLIEVEDAIKPVIACALPVSEGLCVYTNTITVQKAREGVLEFLLINHPLDCPICDQGGECDLQDLTLLFGTDRGRFYGIKRTVESKNISVIIKFLMNRCIHCTRCVRFATEVLGCHNFGITGRGVFQEIGTYVQTIIHSPFLGNIIDLCPVGALTSKPYAFFARPWELLRYKSYDIFDIHFISLRLDCKNNTVLRILPDGIHDNFWLSDKLRFCYDALYNQRLLFPLLFITGKCKYRLSWKRVFINLRYIYIQMLTLFLNIIMTTIGPFIDTVGIYHLRSFLFSLGSPYLFHTFLFNNNFLNTRFSYMYNNINLTSSSIVLLLGTILSIESPIYELILRKGVLQQDTIIYSLSSGYQYSFFTHFLGNQIGTFFRILQARHWFNIFLQQYASFHCIYNSLLFSFFDNCFLTTLFSRYFNGSFFPIPLLSPSSLLFFDSFQEVAVHNQNWKFLPSVFFYNIGHDILFFRKYFSLKHIFIYQGHHVDIDTSFANVILPTTTWLEHKLQFLNSFFSPFIIPALIKGPFYARSDTLILTAFLLYFRISLFVPRFTSLLHPVKYSSFMISFFAYKKTIWRTLKTNYFLDNSFMRHSYLLHVITSLERWQKYNLYKKVVF